MNFKVFLKNNLISESLVLFEDAESDKQKDAFIRSAYKRIIPNGSEKADVDKMWNAIRSKAYYKLSQNSKPETRKAVQQAKGALSRGKQFGLKSDEPEAEEKQDKTVSKKILDHLEDWTEEDFKQLEDSIRNSKSSFVLNSVTSLEDLKNVSGNLDSKDQELLFDLIKKQEHEVEGEIDWKDKTFDDLESIDNEDFNKIKDSLNDTLGVDDSVKLDTIDDLKNYLKDNKPDNDKLQELDKLLDDDGATPPVQTTGQQVPVQTTGQQVPVQTTGQQVPVQTTGQQVPVQTTGQQVPVQTTGQQEPQENKALAPVSTTNQEILDNIQKKQQEAELNDHLKKLGLDITSLDTGDTEVVQKIIDSGDPLLYDTYIAKNLPETSEIVQKIKREEEVRQQVQREALERRTDRFEELKKSGKVLAGIGVIFDVLVSALSGKGSNFFETMAQKQTLAKGIAEGITTQLSDQYEERISNEDSNHAKELDAIKTNYDQRLKGLESQKADPFKTVAYKKLLTMASQKYNESMSELKAVTQEASQRVADVSSLNVFMSTDDFSGLDSTLKNQMTKVLSEKYPRQKIQGEDGTEVEESDDEYLQRIKKEAKGDDIQRTVDEANNDLSQCKEKEKELDDSFNKSLEDLKQNPEVQDEMKLAEQTYKSQKDIIESEYKKAVATENTRYEKTVHCLRKTMDENKRFFKNISVLAMYSDNPQDIIIQEMASRNKKLQDRAKLETGTEIFNEENCPSDPKKLKEWFENASKGSEGKPKKGRDIDDDDDGDDTPKKLKKPNGGDSGEGNPGSGGQGDHGNPGGQGEPDPDETKKKSQPTEIKKGFEELNNKFNGKPKAQERLKKFLDSKKLDLTELDNPDAMSEEDIKVFNGALNEFKSQKLNSLDDLKALGLKNGDKDYTDDELQKLLGDKEQLAKIKQEYGFEDDEGKPGESKKNPIKPNTETYDSIKGLVSDGTKITIDGKEVELKPENFDEYKNTDEFKKYLQRPEALKELSKNDFKNEKTDIDAVKDTEDGKPNDEGKKKLSELSLKTIWQKLNDNGISIRALPGYDPNWSEEQKKKAIVDYLKSNPELVKDDNILTESKTSQKRLSSLIEANDRKIQKRSLKKFAELLVNDVRTFG